MIPVAIRAYLGDNDAAVRAAASLALSLAT